MGTNVVYLDMPCSIKGFLLKNDDGSYIIFINARLNIEQQRKVYNHELTHIINNDFEVDDVNMLEFIRHGL